MAGSGAPFSRCTEVNDNRVAISPNRLCGICRWVPQSVQWQKFKMQSPCHMVHDKKLPALTLFRGISGASLLNRHKWIRDDPYWGSLPTKVEAFLRENHAQNRLNQTMKGRLTFVVYCGPVHLTECRTRTIILIFLP